MSNMNTQYTNKIKIYVPSTIDVDQSIDTTNLVNETLTFLSNNHGGATAYKTQGAWQSDTKGLVLEDVTICESFTKKTTLDQTLQAHIEFCQYLKTTLKQEAVSLEVNNKLYFI